MYEGTLIIEAYCHHRLFDKIDKPDDQKKYFLKIRYLNRGLDNINISDIPRNPDTPLFCNLQSRVRTHAILVVGLYELLGNPTT
jgi:hypothetical protein